jgi:hypothetical protein
MAPPFGGDKRTIARFFRSLAGHVMAIAPFSTFSTKEHPAFSVFRAQHGGWNALQLESVLTAFRSLENPSRKKIINSW